MYYSDVGYPAYVAAPTLIYESSPPPVIVYQDRLIDPYQHGEYGAGSVVQPVDPTAAYQGYPEAINEVPIEQDDSPRVDPSNIADRFDPDDPSSQGLHTDPPPRDSNDPPLGSESSIDPDLAPGSASPGGGGAMIPTIPDRETPSSEVGMPHDDAVGRLVDEGATAFEKREYITARESFRRGTQIDPNDGVARFFLATAEFALGDDRLAAENFRLAILSAPELAKNPIDVRSLFDSASSFDDHMRRLESGTLEDATTLGKDRRFVIALLHFASGRPNASLRILDEIRRRGEDDQPAALLRTGVLDVLNSSSGSIPRNPAPPPPAP